MSRNLLPVLLGLALILAGCEKEETPSSPADNWTVLFNGDSDNDFYFGYLPPPGQYEYNPNDGITVTLTKDSSSYGSWGIIKLTKIFNLTNYINASFSLMATSQFYQNQDDTTSVELQFINKPQYPYTTLLDQFDLCNNSSILCSSDIDFLCGWADSLVLYIYLLPDSYGEDLSYADSIVVNLNNITVLAK